jgi:hypothetical protein
MEEEKDHNFFEGLIFNVRNYFETYLRLAYLSSAERLSVILSRLMFAAILLTIFLLFFFFFSLSLGYYIAEYTGRISLGFAVISLFYMLLAAFLYLTRNRLLKKYLANFFVRSILNKEDSKDE